MFFFTAKLNKRKILALILAIVIIALIIVLIASKGGTAASASGAVVKNNKQRVAYLKSLGWEVGSEPVEEQTVIIPENFDDVYTEYNKLQLSQGFDLSKYAGLEAVRYTYEIKNYPDGGDCVVADMIIYRNRLIAGDVQSAELDGFMHGLEFPKASGGKD